MVLSSRCYCQCAPRPAPVAGLRAAPLFCRGEGNLIYVGGAPWCSSKVEMVCGLPSSSTSKSSACSPVTASPLLLVTTASTSTRRTLLLTLGTAFPESGEAVWG